jgi:nitroreductase
MVTETPMNTDFFELIQNRRSIRAYLSRPVEEEKLRQILEAARIAPSAGNLQAYEIKVVRDRATKEALVRAALDQSFLVQASVVLAFLADSSRSGVKYRQRGETLYCVQDATIACAYAQLAAAALGLGSVWVGAFDDDAVARALNHSQGLRPIALLPIGYPAETPAPISRRSLDDLVQD